MTYKALASGSPYFDDYFSASGNNLTPEQNNYLRILVKPGFAIQARELTQLQTALQNQIRHLSDHFFKDNSPIIGGKISMNSGKSRCVLNLKMNDGVTDIDETVLQGWVDGAAKFYNNATIALATKTLRITHFDISTPTAPVIYYELSGQEGIIGETFWFSTGGAGVDENSFVMFADPTLSVSATCEAGIIYAKDHFVIINVNEAIVGDDTSLQYEVGYKTAESIVTTSTDSSLADNAAGSPNFNAPGADRFQLTPILTGYNVAGAEYYTTLNGKVTVTAADETFKKEFASYIVYENDEILEDHSDVQYSDILNLLAERTYDESGNYTVREFSVNVTDHGSDTSKVVVKVGPGKAFVRGYEVEKQQTTDIDIDRARVTKVKTGAEAYLEGPSYVLARIDDANGEQLMRTLATDGTDITGAPIKFGTGREITFTGSGGGANLGKARIIGIDKNGDDFRIMLDDISSVKENAGVIAGFTVNNGVSTSATIALKRVNSSCYFVESNQPRIYGLNEAIVAKTVTPTIYYTYRDYVHTTALTDEGGGAFKMIIPTTIAGTGNDFVQGDSGLSAAYNITQNNWIDLDNITLAINGSFELEVTFPTGVVATTDDIYVAVKIENENGSHLTKTKTDSATISHTHIPGNTATYLLDQTSGNPLTVEDVYRIKSVTQTTNVLGGGTKVFNENEIAEIFRLDTGARDYYYQPGAIHGFDDVILDEYKASTIANSTYDIVVEYFAHTGGSNSNYFSVDSYNTTFAGDISQIPQYTSQAGQVYDLINQIDFRRKISAMEGGSDIPWPQPFTDFNCEYEQYIPRVDKVYMTDVGDIAVASGISSENPVSSTIPQNGMLLYTLEIPAYTFNPEQIQVVSENNRRYTMQDIQTLEKRINSLEESVSFTAVEKSASDLDILDPATGLSKFKSGIFVDPLRAHDIGAIEDVEYRVAINPDYNSLVCPFSTFNLEMEVPTLPTSTAEVTTWDNLITLKLDVTTYPAANIGEVDNTPAGTKLLAQNPLASGSVNVNPYLTFKWAGSVKITPSIDTWFETKYLPAMIAAGELNSPSPLVSNRFAIEHDVENRWIGASISENFRGTKNIPRLSVLPSGSALSVIPEISASGMPRRINGGGFVEVLPECSDDWVLLSDFLATPGCNIPKPSTTVSNTVTTERGTFRGLTSDLITTRTRTTVTTKVNDVLIDRSAAPFIRRRVVRFDAAGFRQGMNIKVYFDGVELVHGVNSTITFDAIAGTPGELAGITDRGLWQSGIVYAAMDAVIDADGEWFYTAAGGTSAGNMTRLESGTDTGVSWIRFKLTDTTGRITGSFTIPERTFLTGSRVVELIDTEKSSEGSTVYTAQGTVEIRDLTISSTRTVSSRTSTRRGRSRPPTPPIWSTWRDPIAQSFLITSAGGAFLSAIDVYFKTVDTQIPIQMYIVEMNDGNPTSNIVPFSEVLVDGADCNASTTNPKDGQTRFAFSDPIYLHQDTEYAFVLFTNSEKYETWISTLGEEDVFENGTSNPGKGIDRQPYLGSLFKSQNSTTWTADQLSDITFKIWQCQFETGAVQDAFLVDSKQYAEDGDIYNNASTLNKTSLRVDSFTPNIGDMILDTTQISYAYNFFSQENAPASSASYVGHINKQPVTLEAEKLLNGDAGAANKGLGVIAQLQTSNANISPVIDKQQMRSVTTRRLIIDEGASVWDSGKYVGPLVNLENPADEVRILLDAKLPGSSYVEAFYKTKEYVPQYIESAFDLSALNGKRCNITFIDDTTGAWTIADAGDELIVDRTSIGTAVVLGGGNKVYVRSISDETALDSSGANGNGTGQAYDGDDIWFIGNADYALIEAFLLTTGHTTNGIIPLWSATGFNGIVDDYNLNDVVHYASSLWQRNGDHLDYPNGIIPTEAGEAWTKLDAEKIVDGGANGGTGGVEGDQVYSDDTTTWRQMQLVENSRFVNGNVFNSYEFETTDKSTEEFTAYAIKIELKSAGATIGDAAISTPSVKNIRAIAVL